MISPDNAQLLHQQLAAVFSWSVENALTVSLDKCTFFAIGRTILTVDLVKDLDILVQNTLSTPHHCKNVAAVGVK